MNKENLKHICELGTGAILLILLSLIPAIFSILGFIALDNDITILLIICIIISIYNIITLTLRNISVTIVALIIEIIYCVRNNIEHPIIVTILIIPLFFILYYILSFIFDLIIGSIFRKRN